MVLLRQTKMRDKTPLQFETRSLNETELGKIKDDLKQKDWNGLLRSNNCNVNFNTFCQVLNDIMDSHAPKCEVRISWKRKYSEPWMTKGIKKVSNKCKCSYKASISAQATHEDASKYKEYRNNYNRLKWAAMTTYYTSKCKEYEKNSKRLWQVINGIVGKMKHSGTIIPFITINGVKNYDHKKMTNEFGSFYVNLGLNLASKILASETSVDQYISTIPRTLMSLAAKATTMTETEKTINALPLKISSGYNRISNTVLKYLCAAISYPLSIIFN